MPADTSSTRARTRDSATASIGGGANLAHEPEGTAGSGGRPVAVDADRLEARASAPARRGRRPARGPSPPRPRRSRAARRPTRAPRPASSGSGAAGELGREVGDRGLVGLDRPEAGQVDAASRSASPRAARSPRSELVGRARVAALLVRAAELVVLRARGGRRASARRACRPAAPPRPPARRAHSASSATGSPACSARQLQRVGVVEQLAGEVEHAQAAQHRRLLLGPAQPRGDDRAAGVHRRRDAHALAPVDRHPEPARPAAGRRPRASRA